MYEFSYVSAANSTIKEIEEARNHLLELLKSQMGGFDPDKKYRKNAKELKINLSPYEATRFQKYVELYRYIKSGFNVVIEVDKLKTEEIKLEHIESLIKKSRHLNVPLRVFVSGYSKFGNESEHIDMLFHQELLNTFIALNSYLKSNGQNEIRFMEDPMKPESSWTLFQVINANEEVNSVVDIIKMQKFTPFEAITYIHYYLTSQFPYKENLEDPMSPRSIVGLLNSEDIVCVGYAKFVKAVVDKLNMEGLSAETIESVIKPINENGAPKLINNYPISGFAHLQNLVTVVDPKYNVNGTYMNDSCWDAKNDEFVFGKGFGNFMYPVHDAFNYEGYTYQQIDSFNAYDATKVLQSESIIKQKDNTFFKKYSKQSEPIPLETYEKSVMTVLKKTFPYLSHKDVKKSADNYMLLSKLVAASIFSEDAKGVMAKAGRELQTKNAESAIDSSQIINRNEIIR